MRGVKKADEAKQQERDQFVRSMFEEDCIARARAGFIDAPLSAPRAQKLVNDRFKVQLNSQRMYKLRGEVWAKYGLDKEGKPPRGADYVKLPGLARKDEVLASAARDPSDPLFSVCVVPTASAGEGEFLKKALGLLASRGMVDQDLRVDGIHSHYATVSRFKE